MWILRKIRLSYVRTAAPTKKLWMRASLVLGDAFRIQKHILSGEDESGCQGHAPFNYLETMKRRLACTRNHRQPKACAMFAGKTQEILARNNVTRANLIVTLCILAQCPCSCVRYASSMHIICNYTPNTNQHMHWIECVDQSCNVEFVDAQYT